MTTFCKLLALAVVAMCAAALAAVEVVGVSGSNTRYSTPIESNIADKPVKLVLTGTALRRKLIVNVYTIGSYLQEGVSLRTPEELAAVDSPKRLHLVMERDVSGKDMAEAFKSAIRQNHPAPAFSAEINTMVECIQGKDARQGDHVWLTHHPKIGLHINLVGKTDVMIRNPQFSQAVWNIYLGKNNLGETIKRGLVSRLP